MGPQHMLIKYFSVNPANTSKIISYIEIFKLFTMKIHTQTDSICLKRPNEYFFNDSVIRKGW